MTKISGLNIFAKTKHIKSDIDLKMKIYEKIFR